MDKRITALLGQLEQATSDLQAASTLHELLLLIKDLPITAWQRDQATRCGKTLVQRGILSEEHSLMKLISFRVKPYYLPGISELHIPRALPPPAPFPYSRQSSSSSSASASSSTPEATTDKQTLPQATLSVSPSPLPSVLISHKGSRGSSVSYDFLFRPLPPEVKMLCIITRHTSKLKHQPTYRLYLERILGGDESVCKALREELISTSSPIDPRWISSERTEEGRAGAAASPAALAALVADKTRCIFKATKQKAGSSSSSSSSSKGLFQMAVYAGNASSSSSSSSSSSTNGKSNSGSGTDDPPLLGRLQCPSDGVLTGHALLPLPTAAAAAELAAAPELVGSRLCVQVTETKSRVIMLSVVLPAAAAAATAAESKNKSSGNVDLNEPPEVLKVPLGYLRVLCSAPNSSSCSSSSSSSCSSSGKTTIASSSSSSTTSTPFSSSSSSSSSPSSPPSSLEHVLALHSLPPSFNPSSGFHTLPFDTTHGHRVRLPSRKNLALVDITHLSSRDHTAITLGRGGGSSSSNSSSSSSRWRGGSGAGGAGWMGLAGGGLEKGGTSAAAAAAAAAAAVAAVAVEEDLWGSSGEGRGPVVWQMGKVGENAFSLDFRGPFSVYQALGVAMAAFEA